MDARNPLHLSLGGKAFVKTFIAELARLLSPGASRSTHRAVRFSSGSASCAAKSAQTRTMALSVTGLVIMQPGSPHASPQTGRRL